MTTAAPNQQVNAIFASVEQAYGWVPNLIKEMSVSVPTTQTYLNGQQVLAKGSLSPKEQQAVQLTVASANGCHYCQAAHAWVGSRVKIATDDLAAIRSGRTPADPNLAATVETTRLLMEKRGWLTPEELRQAEARGISQTGCTKLSLILGLKR